MIRHGLNALLLIPLLSTPLSAQQAGVDPVETITIAELRDHIFWLASDDLEGRYTGSKGYELAARYCASQFAAAGLQTIVTDEAGNPGYLQTVPIVIRSIGSAPIMTVHTPSGISTFRLSMGTPSP